MATFGRKVGNVTEAQADAAVESLEQAMVRTDDREAPASEPTVKRGRAAKKDLPDIDFGSIVVGSPTDETVRTLKPVKGTRTPQQEQADKLVRDAHTKWVDSGRDLRVSFNVQHKGALSHLRVAAEHKEALKYRLQQSATFLQFRIRFGKDDPNYPGDILFYVTDRPEKKKTTAEGPTSL